MGEQQTSMTDTTQIISKYDRTYGGLMDVCLKTKPSTVQVVQAITGKSETFIVQTFRHPELGDYIAIQTIDENGVVRIILPPKVCRLIGSQNASLTTTGRSIRGRRVMAERMADPKWKPPVPPKRRKKTVK
jgi:hypothetical protein